MSTQFDYVNEYATLGVNLNRQKYGPLDGSSVFKSLTDFTFYIIGTKLSKEEIEQDSQCSSYYSESNDYVKNMRRYAYVGQVVSIVDNNEVKVYKILDVPTTIDEAKTGIDNNSLYERIDDVSEVVTSSITDLSVAKINLRSGSNPVSVITAIQETNGKIQLTGATLTQEMVSNLVSDMTNISDYLDELSSQISSKIFIKNYDSDGNPIRAYSNLSVIKLTDAEYNELIYTGEIYKLSNAIFVVSSDIIDAHQMQIRNMADGTALDDAVTLKQLNDVSSSSHSDFTSALTSTVDSLSVEQITLSSPNAPISVITAVDEISGKVSISATELTQSMVKSLTSDLGNISNEVSTKIFVKNFDQNGIPISDYTNLSVVKITESEYNELIYTEEIYKLSNVIFVVSSDIVNAYGMQIRNVADGTALDDAVTLKQLNDVSSQISTKVFIKNYDDNDNPVSCYDNLSVIKLPDSDYEELVLKDELSGLSNVIFVLSSDFVNAYGMKIKNLADGTNPDDAVTLRQLNAISSGSHRDFTSALTSTVDSLSVEQITLSSSNNPISVITAVDEISGKISISASSLTQSMVQNLTTDLGNISNEVSTKVYIQNQMLSDYVGTLSILQIPRDEFYALLPDGVQPNALYLVSSDTINAYGQRIENLGNAVHDTDAINKGQAIEIIENAFTNMSRDWVCGQISATLGDYEDLENVDWEHITIETVIDMVKFIYSKMGAGKVQY